MSELNSLVSNFFSLSYPLHPLHNRTALFTYRKTVLEVVKKHLLKLQLKGTVQRDLRPLVFFHHSNQPGPLTNWLNRYCTVLYTHCTVYKVRVHPQKMCLEKKELM